MGLGEGEWVLKCVEVGTIGDSDFLLLLGLRLLKRVGDGVGVAIPVGGLVSGRGVQATVGEAVGSPQLHTGEGVGCLVGEAKTLGVGAVVGA